MASGKLVESWTFQRTLPEPFKDYTDDAVFKNIASKYCTQPQKRSTLHAATLQAVLTYMELEEPAGGKSAEELGAIGSQTNTYTVAEYPSRTGELHVVVYNPANGKFITGKYTVPPDTENSPEKYVFKDSENTGTALLFALMPTFLSDEEFNEKYQQLKEYRAAGYPDMDEAAETAAVLCDNAYRRIRYSDTLATGGIRTDIAANGVIPLLKPLALQTGVYAPTEIIHGAFQVLKPSNSFKKKAEAIAKADFMGQYVLSPARVLTPEEELTVPVLPDWYIIPKEVKRICEHAKVTTDTVQPIYSHQSHAVFIEIFLRNASCRIRFCKLPCVNTLLSHCSDYVICFGFTYPKQRHYVACHIVRSVLRRYFFQNSTWHAGTSFIPDFSLPRSSSFVLSCLPHRVY